jgi:AraC family transcriptional regulator, transcriptional activator FtrA
LSTVRGPNRIVCMDIFDAENDKQTLPPSGQAKLHKVAVLVCPQHSLASVALVLDAFRMAHQLPGPHRFELHRVSEDGQPVAHLDGRLAVDAGPECLSGMHLVVVPSLWTQGEEAVAQHPQLVRALGQLPAHVLVAALCTGAYLVAASGRLDGKQATTHWLLAKGLARRYPEVQVNARQNLTHDGGVICTGGSMAALDGCLHAVQQLAGRQVARDLARMLVTDLQRGPQTRFMPPPGGRAHSDREVQWLQQRMAEQASASWSLQNLADSVHLTVRTLQRRFLAATGVTPMAYLQTLRMEMGQDLLASERLSVAEVAEQVGYQDRVAFGRLFKKTTGMTPAAYRQQHGHRPGA